MTTKKMDKCEFGQVVIYLCMYPQEIKTVNRKLLDLWPRQELGVWVDLSAITIQYAGTGILTMINENL